MRLLDIKKKLVAELISPFLRSSSFAYLPRHSSAFSAHREQGQLPALWSHDVRPRDVVLSLQIVHAAVLTCNKSLAFFHRHNSSALLCLDSSRHLLTLSWTSSAKTARLAFKESDERNSNADSEELSVHTMEPETVDFASKQLSWSIWRLTIDGFLDIYTAPRLGILVSKINRVTIPRVDSSGL